MNFNLKPGITNTNKCKTASRIAHETLIPRLFSKGVNDDQLMITIINHAENPNLARGKFGSVDAYKVVALNIDQHL